MRDFDSTLNLICGSVLSEVFGKNGNLVRCWRVDPEDCYKNPQEFDDALVDVFQPMGALLIETRILTRFYRSVGARYSRSDDLNFAAEIRRARIEFEKTGVEGVCCPTNAGQHKKWALVSRRGMSSQRLLPTKGLGVVPIYT